MIPQVYLGSVPPRNKIPKAMPMFSRVSFSTVPMLTLSGDSFTRNSRWRPKTGSSFILAGVVVFEVYLSRLLCFPGRQIECHYFHLDHNSS